MVVRLVLDELVGSVKRKISDRKRFEESAGSWSDFDAEDFKDEVRDQRTRLVFRGIYEKYSV